MNLQGFMKQPRINGRQARWLVYLTPYDFIIRHRPGLLNPADGPSRRPDYMAKAQEQPSLIQKDLLASKLERGPEFRPDLGDRELSQKNPLARELERGPGDRPDFLSRAREISHVLDLLLLPNIDQKVILARLDPEPNQKVILDKLDPEPEEPLVSDLAMLLLCDTVKY